jgi:hypothetical protein
VACRRHCGGQTVRANHVEGCPGGIIEANMAGHVSRQKCEMIVLVIL